MKSLENSKECLEKMILLGKYLQEETGYLVTPIKHDTIRVDDRGAFLITSKDGTKVCICDDLQEIELASPDSFQLILKTIKYCKETSAEGGDVTRCKRCPPVRLKKLGK